MTGCQIGLIDGERLLDLIFEHNLGVVARPATLYELDETVFATPVDDQQPVTSIEEEDDDAV